MKHGQDTERAENGGGLARRPEPRAPFFDSVPGDKQKESCKNQTDTYKKKPVSVCFLGPESLSKATPVPPFYGFYRKPPFGAHGVFFAHTHLCNP
jgi:hypothetical protein